MGAINGRKVILGFDPGGASGVAILKTGGPLAPILEWDAVASVDAAVEWFMGKLEGAVPDGIGIDTPLSWETGTSGWRGPDLWLRAKYEPAARSVLATNSAYGAMLVQGPALALRIHERFGAQVELNESHPKVLYYALRGEKYPREGRMPVAVVEWLTEQVGTAGVQRQTSSDEWDAAISAWATYCGITGCWKHDLMVHSNKPLLPVGPVTYFWPE